MVSLQIDKISGELVLKYFMPFILHLLISIPSILFAFPNTITGKVFDSKTNKPLSDANVEIIGTSIGTATDKQGEFSIKNIPSGKYTLKVTFIGYKPVQKNVNLSYNETVTLKILLKSTIIKGQSIIVTAKADANQAVERESPIAFTTLTMKELANNYTTGDLPELIQNVPGVWTSSAGLGESEIVIRGFTSERTRFMMNDIPMNDPEDHQVYWSNWAGLSNMAQTIEVHRGPGFSLYGSGAFGGSVRIETIGVAATPVKTFRVSTGIFNRIGIQAGLHAGKIYDQFSGSLVENIEKPINYTYSARFNSGPQFNGKFNASFFFEYKTGNSYILGTNYDGFSLGLETESVLGKHKLSFCFFISPQAHNQAFVLQDIDLLKTLGREYNRKNHSWQENYYTKPFWSLKHQWRLSDKKTLVNNVFFTIGKGADQSLVNDVFDVENSKVDFQICTRGKDGNAFGNHAQYLYDNFGLLTTDFIHRIIPDDPSWFKDIEVEFREPTNFFADQHSHSFQNRRRRDHWQFGVISYLSNNISGKVRLDYGIDGRIWRGHRESEAWRLKISNVDAEGRQVWAPIGVDNYTGKIQSIYDYNTRVNNFSTFGRITWKPHNIVTIQCGGQLNYTHSKVIENPIPLLDFGAWEFFDVTKRTTADLVGNRKFSPCNDYLRNYLYFAPWIGGNLNLTRNIDLFARFANAKKEPAILDWYDYVKGPLFQTKYYPDREDAVSLKPESVNSLEFGLGYRTFQFAANANYYYTQYKDKIESVVDINDRRTTMNAGKALFQGIECEIKWRLNKFDFSSSATFAKNRWKKMNVKEIFGNDANDVVGKVVPFSPERMLTASLGYTFNPHSANKLRLGLRLNYWDEYYGTYTNKYTKTEKIIASDNLPYYIGTDFEAKLPYFLDISGQISYTRKMKAVDLTFRIDAKNMLNRVDNFMRAQYTIDYTRNDDQAGRYNWYVLQAPLFNIFFTTEISIH